MGGGPLHNHGDQSGKKGFILTKTWLYVGWERRKKVLCAVFSTLPVDEVFKESCTVRCQLCLESAAA